MIYNLQAHLNPRWRLVIDRDARLCTGGPGSSSCEMIILHNNGHGGIIRVCIGIFTTALKDKKIHQILKKKPYLTSTAYCLLCDRLL